MEFDTEVCNESLAHLSHSLQLVDVNSEDTKEARTCRLFYLSALKKAQRDFRWPAFKQVQALAEVTNPSRKWGKAYKYPANCLDFHGFETSSVAGTAPDESNIIPFEKARAGNTRVIFTDIEDAVGEWTELTLDPELWDADFRLCFGLLLASYIAVAITGGDSAGLGKTAFQRYQYELGQAQTNAMKEVVVKPNTSSSLLRARGGR